MSGDFFFWMLIVLGLIAIAIRQTVEETTKIVGKVAENETLREAGKGLLARWLESLGKR